MRRKTPIRPNGHRISQVLASIAEGLPQKPSITFGELRDQLSGRMYGVLLLLLALPNLIPAPAPGLSAVMGAPLMLLSAQLMLGFATPWFPHFIARRHLKTEAIRRVCHRAVLPLEKLECWVKPRWLWLVHPPVDRLIGLVCLVLSLAIAMPIPFGNALPALAVCFFAIALLQRDGLFVILALVVGFFALSIIIASFGALAGMLSDWLG